MNSRKVQTYFEWGLRLAVLWCLLLVAFGAFVRLSDAGLGCPDWPTCYGKVTWPGHAADIALANQNFGREFKLHHAWPEQVHRILASGLGFVVLILAMMARYLERKTVWLLLPPLAVTFAGAALYVLKHYVAASVLAGLGECLLLASAYFSRGNSRRLGYLLALVCFQGLLGLWTVTWLLKPIVVTAHLLGGLCTLALLVWASLRAAPSSVFVDSKRSYPMIPGRTVQMGLALLLLQIFLGGWVSTNYASLACSDFPKCQGSWLPETDFKQGFVLFRQIGVDYEGGILDGAARTAVHLTHRIGAAVVGAYLLVLGFIAMRRGLPVQGLSLVFLLAVQIALGISNVLYSLPLMVAVAHTAVAALLLCVLSWLLWANWYRVGNAGSATFR
jgi:heme a synthase